MEMYQIISAVASVIMSIASIITIVVSVIQNRKVNGQNNEIIESSNRPYLGIFFETLYIDKTSQNFIIFKNFGKTAAKIISFHCSFEIEKYLHQNQFNPFKHLSDVIVYPNQSFPTPIDTEKLRADNIEVISFEICYTPLYPSKVIKEKHCINYSFVRNRIYQVCPHKNAKDDLKGEVGILSDILYSDLIEKL